MVQNRPQPSLEELAVRAKTAAIRAKDDSHSCEVRQQALLNKPENWQTITLIVANKPGIKIMNDPVKLRQHLMNELFINTHCAFYNGLILKSILSMVALALAMSVMGK